MDYFTMTVSVPRILLDGTLRLVDEGLWDPEAVVGVGDGEIALPTGIGSGDALVGQFVVETKADEVLTAQTFEPELMAALSEDSFQEYIF